MTCYFGYWRYFLTRIEVSFDCLSSCLDYFLSVCCFSLLLFSAYQKIPTHHNPQTPPFLPSTTHSTTSYTYLPQIYLTSSILDAYNIFLKINSLWYSIPLTPDLLPIFLRSARPTSLLLLLCSSSSRAGTKSITNLRQKRTMLAGSVFLRIGSIEQVRMGVRQGNWHSD